LEASKQMKAAVNFQTLVGGSKMSAFERIKKSDQLTDDLSDSGGIFDEFCADRETIATLGVTAEELQELSRASLLGTLTSKDDLLFILRQIRAAMTPVASPSNEPTLPDINHLAETMRLKALAKLDELDLKAERRRRSAVGRVEAALERVSMRLTIARILIVQMSQKLARRPASSRAV
jgi:hypothetical protein